VVFGQTFSLIDANLSEPCYCDGLMGWNAWKLPKFDFGMVVVCSRARPGEGYWNSRPSGSPSPKRELQGFITGLGFEHLAQATILVLERLGLSLRRETLA